MSSYPRIKETQNIHNVRVKNCRLTRPTTAAVTLERFVMLLCAFGLLLVRHLLPANVWRVHGLYVCIFLDMIDVETHDAHWTLDNAIDRFMANMVNCANMVLKKT